MKAKLTDKFLNSAKCRPPAQGRAAIADATVPGLTLRLNAPTTKNPQGLRQWFLRYRPRGQAQLAAVLGHYPALTLAEVHQRARDILNAARQGVDLLDVERRKAEERKAAEARRRTVRQVADDYLAGIDGKLRSYRDIKSRFANHILPRFGDRLIGEVRRGEIVEFLDDLQRDGLRHMVNRARESLIGLFGYAVALAYRRERQARQLDQPAREAAIAAFRARHPELEQAVASDAAARIIAWAAREHSAWFWRGVRLPERR